jgi:uncharacterized protein (DUF1697 family)
VSRLVVLLRGVNLAGANRVPMPELRGALEDAGFENVATYVQSGNVVLSAGSPAKAVALEVETLIADRFGLDIAVVVRTRSQLASVVERDPLGDVATSPKLYLVTFLDGQPDHDAVEKLEEALAEGERLVRAGRELYTWHPGGSGRSKAAKLLSSKALGVTATSRNWSTVTALLALADEG